MNLQDVSTQLLYTTVPIWVELPGGKQSFGTGFIYSIPIPNRPDVQFPLLITNSHVVAGGMRAIIEFVEGKEDRPNPSARVRVELPGDSLKQYVDGANDLVAVPIGGALNQVASSGRLIFFRSIAPDLIPTSEVIDGLAAIEEIVFIGYPSGLFDQHNHTPLIRRGITATPVWNDFQGRAAFLIDAGVFQGSSGSPVFILNEGAVRNAGSFVLGRSRLLFLGVLSEAMLRTDPNAPPVFLGIGKVTKSQNVKALGELAMRSLPPQEPKAI